MKYYLNLNLQTFKLNQLNLSKFVNVTQVTDAALQTTRTVSKYQN